MFTSVASSGLMADMCHGLHPFQRRKRHSYTPIIVLAHLFVAASCDGNSSQKTSYEDMIAQVSQQIPEEGPAQPGSKVVIIGGMPVSGSAQTNFIKLHQI